MGDRCGLTIMIPKSHYNEFCKALASQWSFTEDVDEIFEELEEYDGFMEGYVSEANYAWYDELTAVAELWIPFRGWHNEGGSYPPGTFVSYGGVISWPPASQDAWPVVEVQEGLKISYDSLAAVALYHELRDKLMSEFNSKEEEQ